MNDTAKKTNPFYKTLKTLGRFFLCMVAIIFIVFIVIDIALWAGIGWTRTESGQAWLQNQIATATEDSGLKVEFDYLSYHPAISIRANNLRLSDEEGLFLSLDKADIGLNIFPLAMKKASLHVWANEISFIKIPVFPEKDEETEKEGTEPFVLPNLYFNQFAFNLNIEKLILSEEVGGQELVLSPDMTADFTIQDGNILSKLDLNIVQQHEPPIDTLPNHISFDGVINPTTLAFNIEELLIQSKLYTTKIWGDSDIKTALITSETQIHNENNVPPFNVTLDAGDLIEKPNGHLMFYTEIDGKTISPSVHFLFEDGLLTIDDINGSLPDIDLSGDIKINTKTNISEGTLKLNIKSLKEYSKWIGEFDASGLLELQVSDENGAQKALLTLKNVTTPQGSVKELKAALEPTEKGEYKIDLNAQGTSPYLKEQPVSLKANLLANQDFSSFKDIESTIRLLNGSIQLSGLYNPQEVDLKIESKKFPIKNVIEVFAPTTDIDLSKSPLNLIATLSGNPASPLFDLKTDITAAQYQTKLILDAKTEAQTLKANIKIERKDIKEMHGTFEMPLVFSLTPFVFDYSLDNPIKGDLNASLMLEDISVLFLPAEQDIKGLLKANATVAGTLNKPEAQGSFKLQNGSYSYQDFGLFLSNLKLDASLDEEKVTINTFSANDGAKGTLDIKGVVGIPTEGNSTATDVKVDINNLQLKQNTLTNMIHGAFSTHMRFQGEDNDYSLKGDINVADLDITLIEKFSTTIPELNIVKKEEEKKELPLVVALDIDLKAPQRVFVRGWGLDAEFGGELDITGTSNEPLINGNFESIRGRYEEFGKRFKLQKANMRFQGTVPPSPYLDITASINVDGTEALIKLGGSVAGPQVTFASVPSLPQDEVLSLILFGKSMSSISPFQAVQLAQTVRRFSGQGGGGVDPLAILRNATGLDDLSVENEEGAGVSVGAGKYLTDDVYLEFKKGQEENSGSATLQYEMTPNVTVESEVGQDAKAGGGIFWKWDY